MSTEKLYLIWSYEHAAWWGPSRCGYTAHLGRAGRYTEVEAIGICANANKYTDETLEVMVPIEDANEFAVVALNSTKR
jgi:hypothetical protein